MESNLSSDLLIILSNTNDKRWREIAHHEVLITEQGRHGLPSPPITHTVTPPFLFPSSHPTSIRIPGNEGGDGDGPTWYFPRNLRTKGVLYSRGADGGNQSKQKLKPPSVGIRSSCLLPACLSSPLARLQLLLILLLLLFLWISTCTLVSLSWLCASINVSPNCLSMICNNSR